VAVRNNRVDVVKYLLSNKANVKLRMRNVRLASLSFVTVTSMMTVSARGGLRITGRRGTAGCRC
jgi:hypothetical protein